MPRKKSFFEILGKMLSRDDVRRIEKSLFAAGLKENPERFAGLLVVSFIFLSILIFSLFAGHPYFYVPFLNSLGFLSSPFDVLVSYFLIFLVSIAVSWLLVFIFPFAFINLKAEARRNAIERVLPDFLMLVASNVRAGMTLDQAMWYSAKPEFGLLSKEIKAVVKKSFSGEPLDEALDELSRRFDSKVFKRTILLIKQALSTGGEIAEVLMRTAQDARESLIMKKEISASLLVYELFIVFASVLGAPFLFSVAGRLIGVFEKTRELTGPSVEAPGYFSAFTQMSKQVITASDFFLFTMLVLFVTSVFSSLILGIIRAGNKYEGLKYIPFMLTGAYAVYFIVNSLLSAFFANMLM